MSETNEAVDTRVPLWLHWWAFKAWFHRCPECGHRPDRHHGSPGPRWEDDKIAAMLGIGQYGCRRCGHGSIEERDAAVLRDRPERCPSRDPYDGFLRCQRRIHADDQHRFDGIAWTNGERHG